MKVWLSVSRFLQKKLVLALPVSMVLGVVFGAFFDTGFLKAWMLPLTFMLVFPMMLGFDLRQLVQKGTLRVQAVAQGLNFLLFPLVAFGLGQLVFPGQPALQLGLLLSALLPTSGMTVTWTGLAKGPVPLAVQLVLVGLIAGTLATPFYIKGLLGANVALSLGETTVQMLFIVILPLTIGALLRLILIKWRGKEGFEKNVKPAFPGISTVAVLVVVFAALAQRAQVILEQPWLLWSTFWPVALLYAFNFLVVTLVAWRWFEKGQAIALVYGTVMRNLSIALALVVAFLGDAGAGAALVITWAYVIQVQGAAWYLKILDRVFERRALSANHVNVNKAAECPDCP